MVEHELNLLCVECSLQGSPGNLQGLRDLPPGSALGTEPESHEVTEGDFRAEGAYEGPLIGLVVAVVDYVAALVAGLMFHSDMVSVSSYAPTSASTGSRRGVQRGNQASSWLAKA
jgi:hypothetical protein